MTEQAAGRPVRVVVADDQDIVRDGLVTVLSLLDDIDVVGQARTGREAVAVVREHQPDVVLMDLRMPELDGAAATALLTAELPGVAVLVLTTYEDDDSIGRALTAGARGYLTKDASRQDVAAAIRSVARGQSTFDAAVTARLLAGLKPSDPGPGWSAGTPDLVSSLTHREKDVLRLIGAGLNNAEIAEHLFISTSTVKTHINNLFAKLHLRDRPQAVRLAEQLRGSLGN